MDKNQYIFTENPEEAIMFIHIRETSEIEKVKKLLNAKTLLITSKRVKKILTNASDANVEQYDYDYHIVNDGTLEELKEKHMGIPHGGKVIRTGTTATGENKHVIEYSLQLDSNPEFTASVLVAYARAVSKMYYRKNFGCKTVLDVAPADLSVRSGANLRKEML